MAIRVRCTGCRKKIAIDEAFAGGVCRCPYCGVLNTVAGGRKPAPAAGARPDRPDMPGAPAPAGQPTRPAPGTVGVASPVMIQGVVATVLAGLLLLLLACGGVFLYTLSRRGDGPGGRGEAPPSPVNPITQTGSRVAGMEIDTPVVYVLDGSSGTGVLFDLGAAVVRHSVRGLEARHQFNLIFVSEAGVEQMAEGWTGGGEQGDNKIKAFLAEKATVGASDLTGAVVRAIGASPRTVVVLAGKAPAEPAALARKAKEAGVSICGVSLGAYADVDEAMKLLAEQTNGRLRSFTEDELLSRLEDAPPLP